METNLNVSFDIYSTESVERLQSDNPDILPQYSVDATKDIAYNKTQVSDAITSAIIQGKSIDGIANDLQARIETLNRNSAVKAARTAITNAQNAGSLSAMEELKAMGVEVQKEWVATLDDRTRESHAELDGERRELDEAFSNGLQYPGDTSGDASEVWNCRCTMVSYIPEYDSADEPRLTYSEKAETSVTEQAATKKSTNNVAGSILDGHRNKTTSDRKKWENEYRKHNSSVSFTRSSLPNTYTYTTSEYIKINGYLRGSRKLSGKEKSKMDSVVSEISAEMKKTSLAKDMVCWRGAGSIDYITGGGSTYADAANSIGKLYTDNGFMSTTVQEGTGFGGIKLEIEVPKDTICIYCEDFSCYKGNGENELLLDQGTTFEVVGVEGDKANFTMKLRIVSQKNK